MERNALPPPPPAIGADPCALPDVAAELELESGAVLSEELESGTDGDVSSGPAGANVLTENGDTTGVDGDVSAGPLGAAIGADAGGMSTGGGTDGEISTAVCGAEITA